MEGELALLRRAVERMAVERAEVPEQPDYSETLAGMVQKIDATLQRADALVAAVREAKGAVAAPKRVDFIDALPQTALGKIDKKALRARHWAAAGRAVS